MELKLIQLFLYFFQVPPSYVCFILQFDSGVDFIEVCMKYSIIEKSGAWFKIVDIDTGEILADKIHGQDSVKDYLLDNIDVAQRLEELVDARIDSDEIKLDIMDDEE